MNYPALILHTQKLKENLSYLTALCHDRGIRLAMVSKVVCADERVVRLIEESGADYIADSRIENLQRIRGALPRMLLRLSMPSEAEAVTEASEISLESELTTLKLLNEAALRRGRRHGVLLMIDLGDLREGLYYSDLAAIRQAAQFLSEAKGLVFLGVATNLTCYGSVLPSHENLSKLVAIRDLMEKEFSLELPLVGGGNSSSVSLLLSEGLPKGVNLLRIGECGMLGRETAGCKPLPPLHTDAFVLRAELIEVQNKPSYPEGARSKNAFGETMEYQDVGIQRRGILAVGRQDVPHEGLTPCDAGIRVIGSSSDHLIVDLSERSTLAVGDTIDFTLSYGALLALSTSSYVKKVYV